MSNMLTRFEQEFGLTVNEEGKIVTNSLVVAEKYSKEHKNVMAKIREFIKLIPELNGLNFKRVDYVDGKGEKRPMFVMDRQGFAMLVNKFTGDEAMLFTFQYTKAFEQLEEKLKDTQEYIGAITDKIKEDKVITLDELNNIRFSEKRTIKTFANASMKEIDTIVADFNKYVGKLNVKSRLSRIKSAIDGIERLHDQLASEGVGNIGNCYNLKQMVLDIQNQRHKLENKRNGGHKAAQKKMIKQLHSKIDELMPPELDDYYVIDIHGFSENYIYKAIGFDRLAKTDSYNKWINNFPTIWMPTKEEIGIDWKKPVKLYLLFDCVEGMDLQNFQKSAIDRIFATYGEDDKIVEYVELGRNEVVDSYNEGKIYFRLENV